jgi:hypothetical protein
MLSKGNGKHHSWQGHCNNKTSGAQEFLAIKSKIITPLQKYHQGLYRKGKTIVASRN